MTACVCDGDNCNDKCLDKCKASRDNGAGNVRATAAAMLVTAAAVARLL